MLQIRDLLTLATQTLAAAGVPTPGVDAALLLAHAWGTTALEVRRRRILDEPVPDDVAARFDSLVVRRAQRVPLQYLTGRAPFRHLNLAVGPGVFIPRPETELLAELAIAELAGRGLDTARRATRPTAPPVVVDLGTGSGAVALAIATEAPHATVHAVELDADAFAWAQRNNRELGGVVQPHHGDARTALLELNGLVDVVVTNPPYIPPDAVPTEPEVADYDPPQALYGLGADGLELPRGFTLAASRLLKPGGLFAMEHADVQGDSARELVAGLSTDDGTPLFEQVETQTDLTGKPRFVVARRAH